MPFSRRRLSISDTGQETFRHAVGRPERLAPSNPPQGPNPGAFDPARRRGGLVALRIESGGDKGPQRAAKIWQKGASPFESRRCGDSRGRPPPVLRTNGDDDGTARSRRPSEADERKGRLVFRRRDHLICFRGCRPPPDRPVRPKSLLLWAQPRRARVAPAPILRQIPRVRCCGPDLPTGS